MVSHIRAAAQRLIVALEEARLHLPPAPPHKPGSGFAPKAVIALNVPTGLPAGLAATILPFIDAERMALATAHQKMALAICESGARKALDEITARIHTAKGCATWKPSIGVAMDTQGKMSLWVDGYSGTDAVARAVLPSSIGTHLEALAFALRLCAPIDGTRRWTFNRETFLYPAQDPVDAVLLGVALFNPSFVRTVARGGIVQADVAERFHSTTLLAQLHARVEAALPKTITKRKAASA